MWKKFFYGPNDDPTPVRIVMFGNAVMAVLGIVAIIIIVAIACQR